ncbi:ATP-binding protein [Streptomyces sp. NPDC048718]|uniref:ATP-binding protein n=1 Tax=Streptomyces sp. NPDC048718 TaxID=3365587 RepID=UPI003716E916
MDPINRGPEENGRDTEGADARPGHTAPAPAPAPTGPARVRTARLVSGGLLLTLNPLDGGEIEICPPGALPAEPRRRTDRERAEAARAAAPPVPPGPAAPALPLTGREEQREQLVQHLTRGRSARLSGPAGSGRTTLLDAVAADCAGVAPDGVVRLTGRHRTATDLLYDLFYAVQYAPGFRPDREELHREVSGIGAIVLVDDLEFGGAALDELLAATPDCAFLFATGTDTPAPSPEAALEELELTGLDRADAVALLTAAAGRPLTDDETAWAGDLWFESQGLPIRFVQAGALLRQRDRLRAATPAEFDAFGALEEAFGPSGPSGRPGAAGGSAVRTGADAAGEADGTGESGESGAGSRDVPVPSLGQGAAPAVLLASRLSRSAQETLRFAVALGGEVPHQAHLPALVGDTRADAAVGELLACGLLSPVGPRYRLAAGVLAQLVAEEYEPDPAARAHTAALHYAWWAGHPSVTSERACAEADAQLAALTALAAADDPEQRAAAMPLVRAAGPAFAAGLHWSAWERALRAGLEAARRSGEVAEEAYFHHELGVLALCRGSLQRARAELEASIGMRGAVADKSGTVAGRRALALVADLTGESALTADATPAPASATAETAMLPKTGQGGSGGPATAATAPLPKRGAVSASAATAALPKTGPVSATAATAALPATAAGSATAATAALPRTGPAGLAGPSGPGGPVGPPTAVTEALPTPGTVSPAAETAMLPKNGAGASGAAGAAGTARTAGSAGPVTGPTAAIPAKSAFPDLAPPTPAKPMPPVASKASLDAFAAFPADTAPTAPAASTAATAVTGRLQAPGQPAGQGAGQPSAPGRKGVLSRGNGRHGLRGGLLSGARRNVVAIGAGVLLAAVLGTVVTLGATSGNGGGPATGDQVTSDSTPSQDSTRDATGGEADEPTQDAATDNPAGGAVPSDPTATTAPTATASTATTEPSATPSATETVEPAPTETTDDPLPTKSPTGTPTPTAPPHTDPPTDPTTPPVTTEPDTPPATSEGPSGSASASRGEDTPPAADPTA